MKELSLLLILLLTAGAAYTFYRQKKKLEEQVEDLKRIAELERGLLEDENEDTDETRLF